jgi:hypothetical protein
MEQRELAQSLRRCMSDQAVDVERVAAETLGLFEAAGRAAHVRWLNLELQGYGGVVGQAPLEAILGVEEGHPLVVHVSAYRLHAGQVVEAGANTGRSFQHFFVESLRELLAAAQRVRTIDSGPLRLDFGPGIPNHPATLAFPADVFDRVLLGFRAVLHLELGSLAT